MNPRQLLWAWLMALALVAGLTAGPVIRNDRTIANEHSDVVVIGSSLMAYAVPETGGGTGSLLGDGRTHRRLATLRISERQLIANLERAIDQRARTIFIEVNPLIVDFGDHPYQRPCDGWTYAARTWLAEAQWRVIDAYRSLRGKAPQDDYTGDPNNIAATHSGDGAEVRRLDPLVLRNPCDQPRLAAAVARAKALGTKVVLILPPRSPDGDRRLGPQVTQELASRADALSQRLGIPLFAPRDAWSNDEFVDLAHLNLAGRAHFQQDLRRWWAGVR